MDLQDASFDYGELLLDFGFMVYSALFCFRCSRPQTVPQIEHFCEHVSPGLAAYSIVLDEVQGKSSSAQLFDQDH